MTKPTMASDSEEFTSRKHRRSSASDESEEPSKRRKNRHHRHHRSRKHVEDEPKSEDEVEAESKCEEREEVALPPQNLPPILSVPRTAYDDMEEGEIVEDDGFGGGDADIVKKRTDSDVESGEVLGDLHNYNMGIHRSQAEHGLNFSLTLEDELDRTGKNPKWLGAEKRDEELMINVALDEHATMSVGSILDNGPGCLGKSCSEHYLNGNIGRETFKVNSRPLTGSQSPVTGSCKQKSYYDEGRDLKVPKKSSSCEKNGNRHKKEARSPSHDRYREEVHSRNRSKLHGRVRERSRSQSVVAEASIMKTTQHKDASHYTDNRITISDSDDDKIVVRNQDYQHNNRDLLRDKEREHSSSYSRYKRVDRPHSREARDRESPEYVDNRRTISDLDDDKIAVRSQDYQLNRRDLLRDKERDPSSSYSRHTKWVDKSHSLEALDREREGSRETWDRGREGREVGRDRKSEREQNRDSEREKERDRGIEKDKEREREREGGRRRDREERQWERERERESGRYRIRDSERDKESDRFSRHHNYDKRNSDGYNDQDRYYESKHRRHDKTDHRDKSRKNDSEKNQTGKINPVGEDEEKLKRDKDEQEEYHGRIALQLVDQEEEDINRIKEESRRRRQAILEKYRTQQLQQQHALHLEDMEKDHVEQSSLQAATVSVASETLGGKSEGVDTFSDGPSSTVGKSLPQNGIYAFDNTSGAGGLGEGTPKSERSDDIFCDDIFGESPAGVRKTGKGDGLAIERSGLHDNWDDAEGYYSHRFGEILDGRYEVTAAHGKGVFSTVVRAKDLKAGPGDPDEVAIKIIRNNEHMHKAGKEELVILKKLVGADPDNKRHCVRFLSSFKYRNHLCLVFESLHMNLREVLKKFGRNIGLKLTAVRTYAKQLFIALKHLRNCGVLHCDIKPDNMLVNEAKNVLKLCDFGNAMFAGKNEITPYLVSRFYRAPEIILGLPYDHPMDIWSVGCCLFELYCGKVLFPGATNNDMLRLHMELKGPFPKKMLRKGAFTEQHFDHDLNFLATEEDPVTKKTVKRLIPSIKPKDIGAIVTSSPGEDLKMLANFRDILEKIFVLDPDKRITVSQALSHPFITGK